MPSPTLTDRDLAVLWHPGGQMRDYLEFPPLEVVGARGSRIHLADGRELLDAISSWWCKSLGHRHPRVTAAIRDQLDRFEHVILANTTHESIVRLCERLLHFANNAAPHVHAGLAPSPHFTRVFFADNGSTAVEVALKMALQAQSQRGHPQRTRLASFANGYHGETAAALSVSDCELYRQHYPSLLLEVTKITGLPYRTGPQDPCWHDASDDWPAIQAQLNPIADTLAAIIYEPILQGAGNMRLYSPDLLPRLRRWADHHGVYLIADEIAAGFGRLGAPLASHLSRGQGAKGSTGQGDQHSRSSLDPSAPRPLSPFLPDFAVLSKGLTAGALPMSAVLTTDAIYNLFDADYTEMKAFLHSNTYAGSALGVAAAHAALDEYEQKPFLQQVRDAGARLREGLAQIAHTHPYMKDVRGCGMMAAVDLCDPTSGEPLDWKRRIGYRVYRQAVAHPTRPALLRPIGDTLYLFPPLNTPQGDLDAMLATLADSLDAVFA